MPGFLKHVVVVILQSLYAGKMKASLAGWLKCFVRVGDIRVQAYPQPRKLTILFFTNHVLSVQPTLHRCC